MKLIDADRLEDVLVNDGFRYCGINEYHDGIARGFLLAIDDVQEAPTIDAEPVVKCKDCKYNCVTSYNHGVQDEPRCKFTSYKLSLNDYCSRGAKMDLEE